MLFLERENTENMDPREDRTSAVRSGLVNLLLEKMRGFQNTGQQAQSTPTLPPTRDLGGSPAQQQQPEQQQNGHGHGMSPQLPSLDFVNNRSETRGALTPITERTLESVDFRNSRSLSTEKNSPHGRSAVRRSAYPG